MKIVLFVLLIAASAAHAYPDKPVRVIVAFTPGGVTDIIARTLMPKLAELWKQRWWSRTVRCRRLARRAGSGARVGRRLHAARAFLGLRDHAALSSSCLTSARIRRRGAAREQAQVLVVNPASGLKSVAELIAAAKARRAKSPTARPASAAAAHFNAEKFRIAAGIDLLHIPTRAAPKRSTTRSPAAWSSRSTPSRSRCPTSAMAAWPSSA